MFGRMIKGIGVLMSGVLLTTALIGCSADKSGQTSEGVTTIRVWSKDSHSKAVYDNLINEFNQTEGKEKGIKIEYVVKEGEALDQGLELALQNGEAPELFQSLSPIKELVENKYIMPINDLPGGDDFVSKYEGLLSNNTHYVDDMNKVYCVPDSTTTQGLVYNKDMFKAAGIVDENGEAMPPKTLDELRDYAKRLTNPKKNEYGIIFPMKYAGWYSDDVEVSMMPSTGHMGYDPATGNWDFSGLIPIWQNVLDLINDGSVYPGAESLDNDPARAQFSYGNIGMKYSYSWDVGVFNDQFPANCDWGVAPLPVVDENNCYKQRMFSNVSFYINSKATEKVSKEALMTVYNFFYGEKFKKRLFETGLEMPVLTEYIKDASTENIPNGWKEFAEMAAISAPHIKRPAFDIEGKLSSGERFMEFVLTGKKTPEEVISEYTDDVIKGVEKYSKLHPEIDNEKQFINKDWDIKR